MKSFNLMYFLCVLAAFYCFDCKAQEVKFNSLSIGEGLSQNSVLSIAQDKTGFMWFGTRNGLNRYDSRTLKIFREGSEEDNYITALLCDRKGRLWVGSRNGLRLFDTLKERFIKIPLSYGYPSDGFNKTINSIYEDRKGKLWISTQFALKTLETGSKGTRISTIPLTGGKDVVRCVLEDHEGAFWVATSEGILKLVSSNKGYRLTEIGTDSQSGSLARDQVMSIVENNRHDIWVGTLNGGLKKYDRRSGKVTDYKFADKNNSLVSNKIRRLLLDKAGNLWIGTQGGLSILNLETQRLTNCVNDPWDQSSLSQNSIHSLYRDNTGNMWAGTFFGGVNSCYFYNTPFKVYSNRSARGRLNNNVISSIVEDENLNLWIGTEGGGLNYLDRRSGKVIYYVNDPNNPKSLGSNLVKLIFRDKKNNIWVGTHGGGLNLLDSETKVFKRFLYLNNETLGSEITCMLQDYMGRFWIGTEIAGLRLYSLQGGKLLPLRIPSNAEVLTKSHILSVIETTDRSIWFGGRKGLYVIRQPDQADARTVNINAGYVVNCLYADSNGFIWVGTNNDGLLQYSSDGKLKTSFNRTGGLPDNKVLGICADKNRNLWVSTGNGLCRIDVKNKILNTYTEVDGLAGRIFNHNSYFNSRTGEMFFGGFSGLTSFYPQLIQQNKVVPSVHINGVNIRGQKGETETMRPEPGKGSTLTLRHDQNIFSVDVAVLNFIKAQKNSYKYKLTGYDKDWTETKNPAVHYTNVPPGKYQFVVTGSNNDNVWSKEHTLNITVLPPVWKTWWACTIYGLAILALIFLIIRYIVLRALYQKDKEVTQLKLNFFTNISHEIRTHLSLIIAPVERLIAKENQDPDDRKHHMTIKNNSESLLQLVNELMDFRKAETGHLPLQVSNWNIVPFVASVFSSFDELATSRHISTALKCEAAQLELYFDKEQLEKVFYNLFSNAFKFTPEGGTVNVSIDHNSRWTTIRVTNTGKGISAGSLKKLFDNYFQENDDQQHNTGYGIGLALTKTIIGLHKGTLDVVSEEGSGNNNRTTFTVTLQNGNAHFTVAELRADSSAPIKQLTTGGPGAKTGVTRISMQPTDQTVMIVEDNEDIRAFLSGQLSARFNVIECANGLKGWSEALTQIPDLIISDVMMPGMDGLELSRKLKADQRTSHIPLILLTARNAISHHVDGLQNGADLYLTKPFNIEVLNLQIHNIFKSREALWSQFHRQLNPGHGGLHEHFEETISMHPLDVAFMDKITAVVHENLLGPEFSIAILSKKIFMSQPVINKKIKAITGLSANDYVKSLRLKKAAELLLEKRYTVYEIAYMVGYENSKYFSREFRKYFDKTPTEYAALKEA